MRINTKEPLVRVLAMPMAVGNIIMGLMFIVSGIAVKTETTLPFRMSSHIKGSVCPPIAYTIIEDVIAVEVGNVGEGLTPHSRNNLG